MSSLFNLFQANETQSPSKDRRNIVFVDSGVPQWADIVQTVIPQARVIVIGLETDGVQEITRILRDSSSQSICIIASGCPGCLYLGKGELSLNTLIQYADALASWFIVASENKADQDKTDGSKLENALPNLKLPNLALYGSNLAAGDVGTEFIDKLSQITGAEINASVKIGREIFDPNLN